MKKSLLILITGLMLVSTTFVHASDSKVSIYDLIENAKEYDGKEVVLEGEVIGDILDRGEYVWVNISDGNNSAIGIYMSKELSSVIQTTGNYKTSGDRIRVVGTFQRACKDHGGDLDIHASSVELVSQGKTNDISYPSYYPLVAIGLITLTIVLCYITFRRLKKV